MDNPAAIMASLVDVRNIAAHKCVRLEIHVPVEQAGAVMAAFGWPTAVSPVAVAIARLDTTKAASEPVKSAGDVKERRRFVDLPLSQQAAMRNNEPRFRKFLDERAAKIDEIVRDHADYVRGICNVKSRSEITAGQLSGNRWLMLNEEYEAWLRSPY